MVNTIFAVVLAASLHKYNIRVKLPLRDNATSTVKRLQTRRNQHDVAVFDPRRPREDMNEDSGLKRSRGTTTLNLTRICTGYAGKRKQVTRFSLLFNFKTTAKEARFESGRKIMLNATGKPRTVQNDRSNTWSINERVFDNRKSTKCSSEVFWRMTVTAGRKQGHVPQWPRRKNQQKLVLLTSNSNCRRTGLCVN